MGAAGARVLVVGADDPLTSWLAAALERSDAVEVSRLETGEVGVSHLATADILVYLAAARGRRAGEPDADDAAKVLAGAASGPSRHVITLSSAAVHEPTHAHPGMVGERHAARRAPRNRLTAEWRRLETVAQRAATIGGWRLTILRPAALFGAQGGELGRLLAARLAFPVLGYDPSVQVLDREDLARALRMAVETRAAGTFHLAPRGNLPLRRALATAGTGALPLPRWGHLLETRRPTAGPVRDVDRRRYLVYPTTVSGRGAAASLGFEPRWTTAEAVARAAGRSQPRPLAQSEPVDDFGLDPGFIERRSRRLHGFLFDRYWRIELAGLEHLPRRGRAMLVGVHRGFMPWDGVMAVHAVRRATGRHLRFLIHPALVKFPFLFNLMTRFGGVVACFDNAERILGDEGLLGIYPEGIRGAFSYYRDAHRLTRFGRDQYIRMALLNRAPIVPFVTLGSAETFPILGKLHWRWWKRLSEWPCLPLTPTFPLLPLPLPSKWHTLFLPPIHVEKEHSPAAADDPAVVAELSARIQGVLAAALADLRARRRSVFRGSIFTGGVA